MSVVQVFGVGNPLLDITATVDDNFLSRHALTKNSAIVADSYYDKMLEDLVTNFNIEYSAGGSVQIALRYCQWIIGKRTPVTSFIGTIGGDNFGKIMEESVKKDGVNIVYNVDDQFATGTCAVLLTDGGKSRSLCAFLGASQKFTKSFLDSNIVLLESAEVVLASGHTLYVSPESVIFLGRHSNETGKDFFFDLGASYVSDKSFEPLLETLQYVDYFFADREEALSFARVHGYDTSDIKEVAKRIAKEPKVKYVGTKNVTNPYKEGRVVIITQGADPIIVARTYTAEVLEVPAAIVPDDRLRDTNGAGDAFIGGFLAMYITGKQLEECLRCAVYCASECVQQLGCMLPAVVNFK